MTLLVLACQDARVPFQSELHVKVISKAPVVVTPEPEIEPTVTPEPQETPEVKLTEVVKKKTPVPTVEPVVDSKTLDQMQREMQDLISAWAKRKVTQEEIEAQIPEIKVFLQKAKQKDTQAAISAYQAARKSLDGFMIDSSFISKKVERTLLLLNRSKLPPEKYLELQNRIEKLEKSINDAKYLLVNEELSTLQDEINDAVQLEDVFQEE